MQQYEKSLPRDMRHGEIGATEDTALSPYEAIQRVLGKFKSANEPIPTYMLTNLSHLHTKDPYSKYTRSTKGQSPPSAQQSSGEVAKSKMSPTSSVASADVSLTKSPPNKLAKDTPIEKLLSPKLDFSSALFSSDAAERNKVIADFPNTNSGREKFVLNEYDSRMKKHIVFQAASFELQNAEKGLCEVNNLIHQQRRFEERWPSRYSEIKPSKETELFYDEAVFDINSEVKKFNMTEMVRKSQVVIKLLQKILIISESTETECTS